MTYENDPPRLRVSGDPSDPFVLALEAARTELPTTDELRALAVRLPAMAGRTGVATGGPSLGRLRLRAKSVQAGLFALAAAVAAFATIKYEGVFPFAKPVTAPAEQSPAPVPAPPAPRHVPAKITLPEPTAAPEPTAVQEERQKSTPSSVKAPLHEAPPATRPSHADLPTSDLDGVRSPEAEIALLSRAHQALSGDPARAFALTEQHRRDYPSGALGQESDLIAIEALVALGRTGEAQALAGKFRTRYPSSAHLRRIDLLVGDSAAREH